MPAVTNAFLDLQARSCRSNPSTPSITMCPPSRIGIGRRFRIPSCRLTIGHQANQIAKALLRRVARRLPRCRAGPRICLTGDRPVKSSRPHRESYPPDEIKLDAAGDLPPEDDNCALRGRKTRCEDANLPAGAIAMLTSPQVRSRTSTVLAVAENLQFQRSVRFHAGRL